MPTDQPAPGSAGEAQSEPAKFGRCDRNDFPHPLRDSCINWKPDEAAPSGERISAEQLAQKFHETYEHLAPQFGYATRPESAKPWAEIPRKNQLLMIMVCEELLSWFRDDSERNLTDEQIYVQGRLEKKG